MSISAYDALAALYNVLRDSTDPNAAAIRALVHGGITGIWEAADLDPDGFAELDTARNTAGERTTKALAISLHDLGDQVDEDGTTVQEIGICIWDHANGQDVLRSVRQSLRHYMANLDDTGMTISDPASHKQSLLTCTYRGRSGYRQSEHYLAEYDLLTYAATLSWEDD